MTPLRFTFKLVKNAYFQRRNERIFIYKISLDINFSTVGHNIHYTGLGVCPLPVFHNISIIHTVYLSLRSADIRCCRLCFLQYIIYKFWSRKKNKKKKQMRRLQNFRFYFLSSCTLRYLLNTKWSETGKGNFEEGCVYYQARDNY